MDGLVGLSSLILRKLVNGNLFNRSTVRLNPGYFILCLFILSLACADKEK